MTSVGILSKLNGEIKTVTLKYLIAMRLANLNMMHLAWQRRFPVA
ncbi:unnamed protein product [marine sediment metagenome]|uniref:Uncharacterized protein n=1 Tax=marine sediment metagenome TaxID=412755 RepID=X1MKX4_9ZZZZ